MTHLLSIVHTPDGGDHPYLRHPDERIPRDPIGGDMVSVGFLTQPGHAAERVSVHWTRNGRPQTPIGARPVARGVDADRWLVELGVMEAGDNVSYWIEAEGGPQRSTSPQYRFAAPQWCRVAGISTIEPTTNGIRVVPLSGDNTPGPLLTITQPSADARMLQVAVDAVVQHAPLGIATGDHGAAHEGPSRSVGGNGIRLTLHETTGQLLLAADPSGGTPWHAGAPDGANHIALTLRWLEAGNGRVMAVELTGSLQPDEALVGFGERFDALDQHGRAPDIVVYEQYKNQGNRTYLPVPFFISSAGYGCLIEGSAPVHYDLGRTIADRWRCVADVPQGRDGGLRFDLFVGTPTTMLHTFAALTGRPTMPPAWAFGPWMSSNEWNTQARVLREVQATKHHTIPATVLVIEAWSDETTFYVWNGAHYTPSDGAAALRVEDFQFPAEGPWPDPKAMIDALHDAGIRVVLWQIPALKQAEAPHAQHDADVAHAIEQGYVIRDAAAQPYRNPAFWFNGAFIPDFTNDAATTWWLNKRAYLLDQLGIDGFKTDGGEHLQGRGLQAHDGRRGDELVNAFPNLYVAAYHRFVQDHRHGDALTFSRAGHTGAGAFPAHWAGDENSTWEAYRRSIVAGLTAGISGIPFWGWDIAGFSEALPTAELYVRATAMAAFCPIMQYHSEYNPHGPSRDRTPWNIQRHTGDSRVIPLARFFAQLRMNLLPYIVSEAAHCVASGEPLMRPLLLDDPHDPHAWRVQDQYRFGRHLLVAPVVAEGTLERHLYLPPGTWYDLWDGITLEGGQWIDVAVPWDRIPVYVRAGTILPLNLGRRGALGDDVGNSVDQYDALTFWLYPTDHTEYVWTDTHGEQRRIVAEQAVDGRVQVTLPALPVECTLVLPHGAVQHVTALDHTQTITLRKNV